MVGLASILISNFVVAPSAASAGKRIGYSLVAFLAAIAVAVIIAFVWALFRAPYQQRDALAAMLSAAQTEIARRLT